MAQPIRVVAILIVVPRVGAATFLPHFGRDRSGLGNLQQIVQFQRLQTRGVERLALVRKIGPRNALAQVREPFDARAHVHFRAEHAKRGLHGVLQLAAQVRHALALRRFVPAREPCQRAVDVAVTCIAIADASAQRFFDVQTRRPAEHDKIEQRVAAEPIRAVHRHARDLPGGVEARDTDVVAVAALRLRHAMHVGDDAAHHVVAGRHDGDGLLHRVDVREGLGQFANARQPRVQHFLAQVIQLQHDVIAVRSATIASEDLQNHGPRHHVATGEVFRGGRVALHEPLAVLVDEVAAFAAAAFGHEHARTGDAGRMELPHLDVLHRHSGAQRHADAVAGIDVCVGRRSVNPPGAASGEHGRLALHVHDLAGLHANRDDAHHDAVLIHHHVDREPFIQKRSPGFEVRLVERVQQRMPGAVGRRTGARRLAALAEVLGLSAERALVDATALGAGKRQAHVFEFEHGLRSDAAHVLDGVLVADVIRTFDGVVHVPAPIVVRIVALDGAGDPALRRHGVRAGGKYLGNDCCFQSRLRQLQRGAHPGATATDNDAVERHRPYFGHDCQMLQITALPHST